MQPGDIVPALDGVMVEHNRHMVHCGMSGLWMELVSRGTLGGEAQFGGAKRTGSLCGARESVTGKDRFGHEGPQWLPPPCRCGWRVEILVLQIRKARCLPLR